MNLGGIASAIFTANGKERIARQRRVDDFLIFLRVWKCETERMRGVPADTALNEVMREWRGITIAGWFFEKLRFLRYHKSAIEADLPVGTRLVLERLAQEISGFRPSQLQETQNGALPGRDRLSQLIAALISFLQAN